jgi:DNA-binding transcriptional MerR regulator
MTKKLYKIGEFTRLLSVTPRTIRYYDQCGLLPDVKRSDGGIRLFDDHDIEIIKKVKFLQNEKRLSLEDIKKELFKSPKVSQVDTAIIMDASCAISSFDSQVSHVMPLSLHLDEPNMKPPQSATKLWESCIKKQMLPHFLLPSQPEILRQLNILAEDGINTVFAVGSSLAFNSVFQLYEDISFRSNIPLNFYPVNSGRFGPGTGLLVDFIQSLILQEKTISEINLSLSKSIPMLFQIGFSQSVDVFQKLNAASDISPIFTRLGQFCPVYEIKSDSHQLDVIACKPNFLSAVQLILDQINDVVIHRKKYIYKIVVSYGFFFSEASALVNELKSKYPKTPIEMCELPIASTTIVGPKSINVALL